MRTAEAARQNVTRGFADAGLSSARRIAVARRMTRRDFVATGVTIAGVTVHAAWRFVLRLRRKEADLATGLTID